MRPRLSVLDEVIVSAKSRKSEDVRAAYSSAYSYATTNVLSLDGKVSLVNAFSKQSKETFRADVWIDGLAVTYLYAS